MDSLHPKITTIITCIKCGGDIRGGEKEFLVRCPYCGVEYQLSISAVAVQDIDISERIKILAACVSDGNERESLEACIELTKFRDVRVLDPVVTAYKKIMSSRDGYSRNYKKIETLSAIITNIDDPSAINKLTDELKNEKSPLRQIAAFALRNIFALGNIPGKDTVDALIEAEKNGDLYTKTAVIQAMGKLQDERITVIITNALDDKSYKIKKAALMALGDIKSADSCSRILDMLLDKNNTRSDEGMTWLEIRGTAAQTLGEIGYEPALDKIIGIMQDADEDLDLRRKCDSAIIHMRDMELFKKDKKRWAMMFKVSEEFYKANPYR